MTTVTATEHEEQASLFEYAAYRKNQDPAWALMFAIPNGQYRRGQRPEPGLTAGVPDIFVPVPRGRYHGMFVEMKVGRNTTTAHQRKMLDALEGQGYFVAVCYGCAKAIEMIEHYLSRGNRALEVHDHD